MGERTVSGDPGEEYDPYDDVLEWTEEDEERYQLRRQADLRRRRRRRRQGWSFALIVLIVLAAGVGGAGIAQGWWEWPFEQDERSTTSSPSCADADRSISLPEDVTVRVLNATSTPGLAAAVAAEMERRGYTVGGIGNDESGVDVVETAQVRYGPALLADAQSVALHVPGAVLVDDGRSGDEVDLVVGAAYRNVAPAEQATAAIAAAAPPGCAPTPAATTPPPTPTG